MSKPITKILCGRCGERLMITYVWSIDGVAEVDPCANPDCESVGESMD